MRRYAVASGTTTISFEYDYLCSGGTGVACVSEYAVSSSGPWTTMQSLGAGHKSGHFKHSLPTSPPAVWVRFRYEKATTTGYQDGMWIDDVRFFSDKAVVTEAFEAEVPLSSDWTAAGTDGGFTKQRLPPARAAGPSEIMGPNTTVTMWRDISGFGNAENNCLLTYATDTASTHMFNVWEGTILRLQKSGRSFGTVSIPMTSTSGTKTLKLEVVRDGNPTSGTNLVRVKGITCYTDSLVVGHWDFDGQTIGDLPYEGWSEDCAGSCTGVGWRVVRATPHHSYVPMQTFGSEPFTLNGLPSEYRKQGNPTSLAQFDRSQPADRNSSLWLFSTSSSLHFYWEVNADTPSVKGDESGAVYIYLDNQRGLTLQRQSECSGGLYHHPAATDRLVGFSYALGTDQDTAAIAPSSIAQWKGDCTGGYTGLQSGDSIVNISAVVHDPAEERIAVEMVVDFFTETASERLLGLGLRRTTGTAEAPREFLPFHEYGDLLPLGNDVYSWETIRLISVPAEGFEPTEREDGCCFGKREFIDH